MKTTDTKERLLQAAMKLVSEKGYLGATTRGIAREAGVTEVTLFRHFGSKEQLFEGLISANMFLPRLKELLPRLNALSYEEALHMLATRFLLSLKERKPMVKIMLSEVNAYPEKARRVYGQFIDETRRVLAGYFEGLQKQGLLREFTPRLAAHLFLGMLFSYFRTEEIFLGKDITKNRRMARDVREFVDIFTHGTLNAKRGNADRSVL